MCLFICILPHANTQTHAHLDDNITRAVKKECSGNQCKHILYMYTYIYTPTYIYVYMYIHPSTHIYTYIFIYVCIQVCMKHPQDIQKLISTNFSHFNVSLQRHTHTPTNGHTLVLSLALSHACKYTLSSSRTHTHTKRRL